MSMILPFQTSEIMKQFASNITTPKLRKRQEILGNVVPCVQKPGKSIHKTSSFKTTGHWMTGNFPNLGLIMVYRLVSPGISWHCC